MARKGTRELKVFPRAVVGLTQIANPNAARVLQMIAHFSRDR